jgi:Zn-dependent protease
MFRHTIPIGRIFGISVDLDYSWFLLVGLLTWMLAVSYYPAEFRGRGTAEYWSMGSITAVLLFVSVLIHELGHASVAKKFGIPIRGWFFSFVEEFRRSAGTKFQGFYRGG